MNIVETFDLTKRYDRVVALDQVNLAVSPGSILGVIGAQGAGKTTLLRICATLSIPTAGDVLIAGISVTEQPAQIRNLIGYISHHTGVYPDMTVDEYMHFFADGYAIRRSEQTQLISDLLALVDMSHHAHTALTQLSPGMQQRLSLARALIHDPQVLLMDEPISNADPRAHVEMRELIKELRNMGKTIIISAPIVADIADLCTNIAILDRGRIVLSGTSAEVYPRLHHHRVIVLKFFGNVGLALSILHTFQGVRDVLVVSLRTPACSESADPDSPHPAIATILKEVHIAYDGSYQAASDMLFMLVRSGVQVVSFREQDDTAQALIISPDADAGELEA
jgi:ABC-2 type transport system ATP-binding protein